MEILFSYQFLQCFVDVAFFAPGYFFTGFCSLAVLNFSIENNEKNDQKTNKNGYDLGIAFNTLPGTVLGRSWGRFWEAKWSPGRPGRKAK